MSSKLILDGHSLTPEIVIKIAVERQSFEINTTQLESSRQFIQKVIDQNEVVYGVTTGFGPNVSTVIDAKDAVELQRRLLLSHAVGTGAPFSAEIVRAILVIRLNTLLAGFSGIQEETVRKMQFLLQENILPWIPQQGSVGASGDLCPLAHMALPLIGEGYVVLEEKECNELNLDTTNISFYIENKKGKIIKYYKFQSKEVLLKTKWAEKGFGFELSYKEGLALTNGTTIMAALGVLATHKTRQLLELAVKGSALIMEGLCARSDAFDEKLHLVRRHSGQQIIASKIRDCLKNSDFFGIRKNNILCQLENAPEENENPNWRSIQSLKTFAHLKSIPQDAYSIRCVPQVLGASWKAMEHVQSVVADELNAVVDNPIIFTAGKKLPNGESVQPEMERAYSGGNFHGQPIALVLDYLKIAIAEIGNLVERQVAKMVDKDHNHGLPAFLAEDPGLNSGLMILQYVAAGLVSENKVLSHPASVDSIPTSANQEDHVSMGPIAGRQALEMIANVEKILAIQLIVGAQAVDLRKKQFDKKLNIKVADSTKEFLLNIRKIVPYVGEDRFLHQDLENLLNRISEFYN